MASSSLRILVPIKRVLDYTLKPRINASRTGIDITGLKQSLNPFDELSIEAALQLREAHPSVSTSITAITAGPAKSADALRTAMAMGADRGIHILTPPSSTTDLEPLQVAKMLRTFVKKEDANLVLMGKQSIDNDAGQTGQILAGLLGWPQATQAAELTLHDGDGSNKAVTVVKEVDGGTETLKMSLPAVVTADLRLNEPRYASLPGIMKAKKKPLLVVPVGELMAEAGEGKLQIEKVEEPPARVGGGKVSDVDGLLSRLKELGAL